MGNDEFSEYKLMLIKALEDLEKDVESLTKQQITTERDLAILKVTWTIYMGILSIVASIGTALLLSYLEIKLLKS